MLNLTLLFRKLDLKLGSIDMRRSIPSLLKNLLCSLPMGLAAYFICSFGDWTVSGNVGEKILLLGIGIVVGLGVYLVCSYWAKNEEMFFLMKMVRKKI